MNISDKGIEFIKKEEGCVLTAYKCPANVWTIGYGHTANVKSGDKITLEEAEELLRCDLKYFEDVVNKYVKIEISQNKYDALVSFCYNVGTGNFISSTLLKKVNDGCCDDEICEQFNRWVYAKGKKLPVLVARRKREADLYREA